MDLLSQVEKTLLEHPMLTRGEQLLVACSGGADSTALFHLLREIAPRWGIQLSLLHLDHGLRQSSAEDFKFVRSLAKKFCVPFYGERKKMPRSANANLSPEEHAREFRYQFFEKISKKTRIRKIALAHHSDDQAETVLMRVIQGTGLRGLQGIRPIVRLNGVTYIRPLIETSRTELREYLKKRSLTYREDPTNRSTRFLRNQIRIQLLPRLKKEFNPQIEESLCRLAQTAAAELSGLDEWVEKNWRTQVLRRRNGTIWLHRESFLALPHFLKFRLLAKAAQSLESRSGIDFETWRRIENNLSKPRLRMTLPRNLDLNLTPKKLFIRKSDTMAARKRRN